MRKCNKCNLEYNGNLNRCPLCITELIGEKTPSVFPNIKRNQEKLLTKILLFISISIGLIFAFCEFNIRHQLTISKIVILGLLTNYILTKIILNNYKNILKMINKYFTIIMLLCFIWYICTKSLIITTYFIPILCLIIFAFNSIIMLILKNSYIMKFTKTIILDCFIGFIPLLLVHFNMTTYNLLSYICAILNLLVFLGLLIFCHEEVIEELKKIFNF